jgi:SAM-dependent methyltransferase
MGYVAGYFEERVAAWIESGWLPRGGRVADFGAQEFHGDPDEARRMTRDFLRRYGAAEWEIEEICLSEGPLSAARIYRAIGMDYVALDIQQGDGIRYFDLNSFAAPLEWRTTFDLVNNEGAIEHLINPLNGFQVAHELLKVGGVALHSIPLAGHANHGLMHPTVKFYSRLLGANGYELLLAEISIGQSQPHGADQRFVVRDRQGRRIERRIDFVNAWLHFGYRKTSAVEFRPPFSHWNADQAGELDERVAENAAVFSSQRLIRQGRRDALGQEFERQVELQRREYEHALKLADREYEHAGISSAVGRREYLLVFAVSLITALNGAGLLLGLAHASAGPSWPFAAGLVSAFLPVLAVSTGRANSATTIGLLIRHGSRALWLVSAILFVVGCLGQRL